MKADSIKGIIHCKIRISVAENSKLLFIFYYVVMIIINALSYIELLPHYYLTFFVFYLSISNNN